MCGFLVGDTTQSKKILQIVYIYICIFICTQINLAKIEHLNLIFILSIITAGIAMRKLFSAASIQCVQTLSALKFHSLPVVEVVPFKTTFACLRANSHHANPDEQHRT